MNTINQSPAGQVTRAISGIEFDTIAIRGAEPFRERRFVVDGVSVAAIFGGEIGASTLPVITLLGRLIGRSSTTSTTGVSGIFSLREQAEAKRRNAWPL